MGIPTISIRMLGGFEVLIDGHLLPARSWSRRRAADLVKLLALAPGHRLTREQVMEALWPGLAPARAGANLRKAAYHARRAMGLADAVTLDGSTVRLGGRVDTDAESFAEESALALESGDPEACRRTAAAYPGDLLPDDLYADWCVDERARLRARFLQLLEQGALWGRLVEEEPVNEVAHQEIIAAHLQTGDRAAALRQFEELRRSLRSRLGVSPNPASMDLYDRALTMDAPDAPTPAERARALLAWGVVHWERRDVAEVQRTATHARALAIDAGLGRELVEANELLALVAYAQGAWRRLFAEQVTETLHATPEMAPFLLDAHICMAEFALNEEDGVRDMTQLAEDVLAIAGRAASTQGEAIGRLMRGESNLVGEIDLTEAREDLERAKALFGRTATETGLVVAVERLAQIDDLAGDRAAGAGHRRALELASRSPVRQHLLPFVYGGMLGAMAPSEALGLIEEAERATREMKLCDPCSMTFRVRAAQAAIEEDELDRAKSYLTVVEQVSQMWTAGPWHGAVSEIRARLLLEENPDDVRIAPLLEDAASRFEAGSGPAMRLAVGSCWRGERRGNAPFLRLTHARANRALYSKGDSNATVHGRPRTTARRGG